MASDTIDLDEIAPTETLDPRQVKGCIPVRVHGMFYERWRASSTGDHVSGVPLLTA
jgi:hypothetical protein